jgi:Ring finger domain
MQSYRDLHRHDGMEDEDGGRPFNPSFFHPDPDPPSRQSHMIPPQYRYRFPMYNTTVSAAAQDQPINSQPLPSGPPPPGPDPGPDSDVLEPTLSPPSSPLPDWKKRLVPLTDEQITLLPVTTVTADDIVTDTTNCLDREEYQSICPICIDEYQCGDSIMWLPCFHYLHEHCAISWLKTNCTCPMCKDTMVVAVGGGKIKKKEEGGVGGSLMRSKGFSNLSSHPLY